MFYRKECMGEGMSCVHAPAPVDALKQKYKRHLLESFLNTQRFVNRGSAVDNVKTTQSQELEDRVAVTPPGTRHVASTFIFGMGLCVLLLGLWKSNEIISVHKVSEQP